MGFRFGFRLEHVLLVPSLTAVLLTTAKAPLVVPRYATLPSRTQLRSTRANIEYAMSVSNTELRNTRASRQHISTRHLRPRHLRQGCMTQDIGQKHVRLLWHHHLCKTYCKFVFAQAVEEQTEPKRNPKRNPIDKRAPGANQFARPWLSA